MPDLTALEADAPWVTLPEADLRLAEQAATEFTKRAQARGYKQVRGADERFRTPAEDFDNMLQAIGAEIAVARYLDLPWHDPQTQSGKASPDVGRRCAVRWTRVGALYLFADDPPEHAYFLVSGARPSYALLGQIEGKDAKVAKFYHPERRWPGWVVPAESLHPVQEAAEVMLAFRQRQAARAGVPSAP